MGLLGVTSGRELSVPRSRCDRMVVLATVAAAVSATLSSLLVMAEPRGLVVTKRVFDFVGGDPVRTVEIRTTLPDRQCVEWTRVVGDSVVSHGRVIWRLDQRTRWDLDLMDRTYTEANLRTEQELWDSFGKMIDVRSDSLPVDLREDDTIVGAQAERYRYHLREPKTDSIFMTVDCWVAAGLPGASIRQSFSEALDRARGGTRARGASRDSAATPISWPRGSLVLRSVTLLEDDKEPQPPKPPAEDDTSLAARMARAWGPKPPPEANRRLADSLARAWRVEVRSHFWQGEEVMSVREAEIPDSLFEIPPRSKHRALSESKDWWPWAQAAQPPASRHDPHAPPRLNPFATLDAKRNTLLRPDPSTRHAAKFTAHANDLLGPVELEPVNGFYRVKDVSQPNWPEGWVAAADVEEMGEEGPSNISASESQLNGYALELNSRYRVQAISSTRIDSGRVVVTVGNGWWSLDAAKKRGVGFAISSIAAGGRGAANVVFRDSLTSRTVATHRSGVFKEY